MVLCEVLPLWTRVDLGVMTIERYSELPNAPELLKPRYPIIKFHNKLPRCEESFLSVEKQSVYSTVKIMMDTPVQIY